jgi:acyl carrier protein
LIIEDKVKQIISETFKVRRNDITMEMTAEDIELWDSLGQLILISNLEKEFNVIFELEEIFEIMSIRDIIHILERKG